MAYAAVEYHGGKNHPEQVTDEFMTCRLCEMLGFRQPKILQCGHVFCLRCLEEYWGTGPNGLVALPDGMRPPYMGHHGGRPMENPCREYGIDRVGINPPNTPCPICQIQVPIPEGGLHSLPNYILANTQIDRLLRRHNTAPMPAIEDPRLYNIHDYRHYGHTRTAALTLPHPQ